MYMNHKRLFYSAEISLLRELAGLNVFLNSTLQE